MQQHANVKSSEAEQESSNPEAKGSGKCSFWIKFQKLSKLVKIADRDCFEEFSAIVFYFSCTLTN